MEGPSDDSYNSSVLGDDEQGGGGRQIVITNEKNNRYFSALFHMVRRPQNPIDMVLNIKFALKRVPSGMASTPAVTVVLFHLPF